MKVILRQIYSYNFHFFKLNNLKVIHDLYSQCLTQILSKTSSKSYMEGVSYNLVFQELAYNSILVQLKIYTVVLSWIINNGAYLYTLLPWTQLLFFSVSLP